MSLESAIARLAPTMPPFEPGHVWNALRLIDDGLIPPPYWFQFVLGVRGGPVEAAWATALAALAPRDTRQ